MTPTLVSDFNILYDGNIEGWVEVYDDYSLEWEYDGPDYPNVKKALTKAELDGPGITEFPTSNDGTTDDDGFLVHEWTQEQTSPEGFAGEVSTKLKSVDRHHINTEF